jgi:hypothetical protein
MRQRIRSLCLLLALSVAWTSDLQAKTQVTDVPQGSTSSLQEVYPLALSLQAQIRDRIEAPPMIGAWYLVEGAMPGLPDCWFRIDPAPKPWRFSGSDACYLYMSLQR